MVRDNIISYNDILWEISNILRDIARDNYVGDIFPRYCYRFGVSICIHDDKLGRWVG